MPSPSPSRRSGQSKNGNPSNTRPHDRSCSTCGGHCDSCGDACPCSETLCQCQASSVLNSLGTATASSSTVASTAPSKCKAELLIGGMTCSMCSLAIERTLTALPAVLQVSISLTTDTVLVEWYESNSHNANNNQEEETLQDVKEAIESVGYTVEQVRLLGRSKLQQQQSSGSSSHGSSRSGASSGTPNRTNRTTPPSATSETLQQQQQQQVTTEEETVEARWERVRLHQEHKVRDKRRAFLLSLTGTLPILVLTMILPHLPIQWQPRFLHRHVTLFGSHLQVELQALLLWFLATPVQFGTGFAFYRKTWFALRANQPLGMDVLVAVSTSASYAYALAGAVTGDAHAAHFFETCAVLICFVLLGQWMQASAVRRTSAALTHLMELLQSKTALKVTPFKDRQNFDPRTDAYMENVIPTSAVQKGDLLKILKGASIPADGRILYGSVSVDESMVTGEAMPVLKTTGSLVLGGTICVESGNDDTNDNPEAVGAAFLTVTGVGSSTALAQIVQLVQDAQTRALPVQSYADQVSAVFVPTVCLISLLTFLTWYALCSSAVVPVSWYQDLGEDAATFSLLFSIACLVISCPCALGLATPTACMVGTGVGAKHGILFKGGDALEVASQLDALVFDKTGTLTKGKPVVSDCQLLFLNDKVDGNDATNSDTTTSTTTDLEDDPHHDKLAAASNTVHASVDDGTPLTKERFLWLLASLERTSEHPLAQAVVQYATQQLESCQLSTQYSQPTQFFALTGRGCHGTVQDVQVAVGNRSFFHHLQVSIPDSAEAALQSLEEAGKTAILAAVGNKVAAVLGVADEIKPDAAASIRYLRDTLKVDVWMVTGDHARTAEAVRQQLGLPENRVVAQALPAAKLAQVRLLQSRGYTVGMVGDGVNDSPALAAANVGMSLGTGAQIACEASDLVLVKGHVTDVCTALDLSRAIFKRIQWNLVWSMLYNCLGIPVAAGAFYPIVKARLPPTLAALCMALSSVSVVLSSLTLRFYQPPNIDQDANTATAAEAPRARRQRRNRRRRVRRLVANEQEDDELATSLLEGDSLETNANAAAQGDGDEDDEDDNEDATEATDPMDNRTAARLEEGR